MWKKKGSRQLLTTFPRATALRNDVEDLGASPSSSARRAEACCIVSASNIKFSIAPANRSVAALWSPMVRANQIGLRPHQVDLDQLTSHFDTIPHKDDIDIELQPKLKSLR